MRLLILFLAAALYAQTPTPGTITKTGIIAAVAGTVTCTFTAQVPADPKGISVTCKAGDANLIQTAVVPVGSGSGVVGSLTNAGDSVTWILTQPVAGTVTWQIAANGRQESGTF